MNEPAIEIVTECEHGQEAFHILPGAVAQRVYGQAGYGLAEKDMCSGGRRVRLSRQEAIDLAAEAIITQYGHQFRPFGVAAASFDALLGID